MRLSAKACLLLIGSANLLLSSAASTADEHPEIARRRLRRRNDRILILPEEIIDSDSTESSTMNAVTHHDASETRKRYEETAFWSRFLQLGGEESASMSMALPMPTPTAPVSPPSPVAPPPTSTNAPTRVLPEQAEPTVAPTATVAEPTETPVVEETLAPTATTTTAPTATPQIQTTLPPTLPPGSSNFETLLDAVTSQDDLTTLASAATAAGILDLLQQTDTDTTLIAPVNDAFAALDPELLSTLLTEAWVVHLRTVLAAHVIPNTLFLGQEPFPQPPVYTALSGDALTLSVIDTTGGTSVSFTGPVEGNTATVLPPALSANNGIVHKADAVLLPLVLTQNLAMVLNNDNDDLTSLYALVVQAGLEDVLANTENSYTLLAPTNDAIAALPADLVDNLNADNVLLSNVLLYHVLNGVYPSELLTNGQEISTAFNGNPVTVEINDDTGAVSVNQVGVVTADTVASNGLIHKLTAVLLPPNLPPNEDTPVPTLAPTQVVPLDTTPPTVSPTPAVPEGGGPDASDMPSDVPSAVPTSVPVSDMPSDVPSALPSSSPVEMPDVDTSTPTLPPTVSTPEGGGPDASDAPSSVPSDMPVDMPDDDDTNTPTLSPTVSTPEGGGPDGSDAPSSVPSDAPVEMPDVPSSSPGTDASPSDVPSTVPSTSPPGDVTDPTPAPVTPETTTFENLLQAVMSQDDLATLATAAGVAGIVDLLTSSGDTKTLLAPNEAAFDAVDSGLLETLLDPAWVVHLRTVLAAHVIPDEFLVESPFEEGSVYPALSDDELTVSVAGGFSFTSQVPGNTATVLPPALVAENGIVHKVDTVLFPLVMTQHLVTIASGMDDLGTLVSFVVQAGLDSVLSSATASYTVLAPVDAAFADLPDSLLESLNNDDVLLANTLLYHVLPGVYPSEALSDGQEIPSVLDGAVVSVSISEEGTTFGGVGLESVDFVASNGLIHKLTGILLAPTTDTAVPTAAPVMTPGAPEGEGSSDFPSAVPSDYPSDIPSSVPSSSPVDTPEDVPTAGSFLSVLEAVTSQDDLETLASVAESAGITGVLTRQNLTLLAPTDEAFDGLDEALLQELLLPERVAHLRIILFAHVIPEEFLVDSFADNYTAFSGDTLTVSVTDGVSFTSQVPNNTANVLSPALSAPNGIVHKIDAVLLPLCMTQNLVEMASAFQLANLTSLLGYVVAAGLEGVLADTSNTFTVLAPNNDAFAALPSNLSDSLNADPDLLSNVLLYHVLPGLYPAQLLTVDQEIPSAFENIPVTVTMAGAVSFNAIAAVVIDQPASNGLIHVLGSVLLPPSSVLFPPSDEVDAYRQSESIVQKSSTWKDWKPPGSN